MDSSVTPTSPSEMAILVAGLLIMLFGVYKVYRERAVRPLILWGASWTWGSSSGARPRARPGDLWAAS